MSLLLKFTLSSKKAFTAVELLVVVAIIGILVVGISGIDFNGMNARQKRDRMASAVITLIRNDFTKNSTGKAIGADATHLIFPTKTNIVLAEDEIRTEYYSGSTIFQKEILTTKPFFGDEHYILKSGTGTQVGGTTFPFSFGIGESLIVELQNGKDPVIYYMSGASRTDMVSSEILTGFNPEFAKVIIDSRNNLVQTTK